MRCALRVQLSALAALLFYGTNIQMASLLRTEMVIIVIVLGKIKSFKPHPGPLLLQRTKTETDRPYTNRGWLITLISLTIAYNMYVVCVYWGHDPP